MSTLLVPLRWKARSPQAARKKGPARCQTVTITTPAEKTWTSGLCERSWHESAHRGDVDTDAEHDHGRAIGEPPTLGRLHPYNGESSQFFARVAGLVTFLLLITIPFGIASFTLQRSSLPFGRTAGRRPEASAASNIGNVLWLTRRNLEGARAPLRRTSALPDDHRCTSRNPQPQARCALRRPLEK